MTTDLTSFEAEVLSHCQALQAEGVAPTLGPLARRMGVNPAHFRMGQARRRLMKLGLVAIERKSKAPPKAKAERIYEHHIDKRPEEAPKRAEPKPERHSFAADVRTIEAVHRRLGIGNGKLTVEQENT